jgi:hypothetical protein
MGGGSATPSKPTSADVTAGTGSGWLMQKVNSIFSALFPPTPELSPAERLKATSELSQKQAELMTSPVTGVVTQNSGLSGQAARAISDRNAQIEAVLNDISPPPKGP